MNWGFQKTRLFLFTTGHCRGPPASGVFMISNSDSEKGWVVFLKQKSGGGSTRWGVLLICLWLCICICICVFCFASTRWWVLWEIRDYLGPPCVCDTAFANTCLWLCICVFVFGSTRWRVLWEIQDYSGPPQGREQWSIIQQPANESVCSTSVLA